MPGEHLEPELREVRPAVVDGRGVDGPQHPVGHVGRAGDLQEVAPAAIHQTFHTVASGQSFRAWRSWRPRWGGSCAGEVRADAYTRHLFAADASMFALEPLAVAFPRDADDVAAAVAIAARLGVPVVPRGGGHEPRGPDAGGRGSCSTSRGT